MNLEGQRIGRYYISRLLGRGGMGEVFLAADPRIEQEVAIKVVRTEDTPYPNLESSKEGANSFLREARAIARLLPILLCRIEKRAHLQPGYSNMLLKNCFPCKIRRIFYVRPRMPFNMHTTVKSFTRMSNLPIFFCGAGKRIRAIPISSWLILG